MTNRLELNWKLDGFVDEQRYYCSGTPIDPENLPTPTAILTGDVRSYLDSTARELGRNYHIYVSAVKNNVEKISLDTQAVFGKVWAPSNLANAAKIWSDTDSLSTGALSVLENKGVIETPFTQSASSRQPQVVADVLNGHGVISFDGVDDYIAMQSESAGDLFRNTGVGWLFTVFKRRSGALLFDVREPSGGSRFLSQTTSSALSFSSRRLDNSSTASSTAAADVSNFGIRFDRLTYSSANLLMRFNGEQVFNASHGTAGLTSNTRSQSNYVSIGERAGNLTGTPWGGDIACIIAGSGSAPTSEEILKLEGWAAHKYGLTGNLPADHPYKILVPTI
ncbi:MAG: hypothetical protein RSC05_15540 [Acinetobacter sp.]